MPSPCCVPMCKGNYKTGPKVSVFTFPSEPFLKDKWIRAIHRENFVPTKYSKVCELHFSTKDFLSTRDAYDDRTGRLIQVPLVNKRLAPEAVPSIFKNQPEYLSAKSSTSREDPGSRAERKEMDCLHSAITESIRLKSEEDELRRFSSLDELMSKKIYFDMDYWTFIKREKNIMFIHVDSHPSPKISHSFIIDSNLEANVFVGNCKVKLSNFTFPLFVCDINVVSKILDELKDVNSNLENKKEITIQLTCDLLKSLLVHSDINTDTINFLSEQISLLGFNKYANRYSSETLIFSTLLYTIAPCAYKFLRQSGLLIVPHPNTLNRLCVNYDVSPQLELLDSNFLKYVGEKFKYLHENDKSVILMIDEVHLREYFEFKGGNISGMAYDAKTCASSAQVFMLKSIASQYKDVVHVLPVHTINGDFLHLIIKKIVIGLEDIGFQVICVITDNNSINRNAMSQFVEPHKLQFVYPHPVDKTRPLFFLIDTVHILKCIRNNWLNQKNDGRCFFFPNFEDENLTFENEKVSFQTARFNTIKDLHNLESGSLVKYGFKLNLKAIAPSSMEKQNVNLVLCIFNEFVAQALIELGGKHNLVQFKDTSDFLKIIIRWWNIVNVKSPNKGQRLKNVYQEPLKFKESDEKLIFLYKFLDWIDAWHKMKCTTGMFTRETRTAIALSTNAIIEIVRYCSEELKMKYILPGKFQTDDLESRFGCYRRLSGCQYNISSQQLFESEKKLRIQSLLHLNIPSKSFGNISIDNFEIDEHYFQECELNSLKAFPNINISKKDIKDSDEYLPTLMYLAGYCIFRTLKQGGCKSCKTNHQLDKNIELTAEHNYLKSLDRGSLSFPRKHILNVILINYITVKKLCTEYEPEFLKLNNQRSVAASITLRILEGDAASFNDDKCDDGHSFHQIIKKVIWCSSNIFLNNYTKKKNDDIREAVSNKKNLAAKKAEMRKAKCTKIDREQTTTNENTKKESEQLVSKSKKKVETAKKEQKTVIKSKIPSKQTKTKKIVKQNDIIDFSDVNWNEEVFSDA